MYINIFDFLKVEKKIIYFNLNYDFNYVEIDVL